MSRIVPLSIGIVGILLLVPGVLSVANPGLTEEDVLIALKPILSVPLDKILAVRSNVLIPDTLQWKRISRKWGEPEFIISAVSSENRFVYCLPDLALTVQVTEHGNPITLNSSYTPEGFSQYCNAENANLRFRAKPGTELTIVVRKTDDRPMPEGELIIVGGWLYTKDKLVGISFEREARPVIMVTSVLGFILIVSACYWLLRRRVIRR